VRIIKQGRKENEIEYEGDCYSCKTKFAYKKTECKYHEGPAPRFNESYYEVNCPYCQNDCKVYPTKATEVKVYTSHNADDLKYANRKDFS
jgi:ribosomal protein S27E